MTLCGPAGCTVEMPKKRPEVRRRSTVPPFPPVGPIRESEAECQLHLVPCPQCGQRLRRRKLAEHGPSCPKNFEDPAGGRGGWGGVGVGWVGLGGVWVWGHGDLETFGQTQTVKSEALKRRKRVRGGGWSG